MALTEHAIQVQFTSWLHWNEKKHPELQLAFAIPNGGARSAITGANLKAEGVRKGIPDYCLPVARNGYIALWMEFKTAKGRVSTEQSAYMEKLMQEHGKCVVVRSLDDAINAVDEYLRRM